MSIRMTIGVIGMPYPEDVNDLSQLSWSQLRDRLSEAAHILAKYEELAESQPTDTAPQKEIDKLSRRIDDLVIELGQLTALVAAMRNTQTLYQPYYPPQYPHSPFTWWNGHWLDSDKTTPAYSQVWCGIEPEGKKQNESN